MDKEKIKENVKKLKQGDTKRYRDSIKELVNKYPSGAQISNSPFNPKALRNKRLRRQILEVPVQTKPVPVPEKKYYIC